MKKVSKAILKAIVIILITTLCFLIGRQYALYERGYKAVGGEHLIFIIPSIAYLIKEAIRDYREFIEDEFSDINS